MQTKINCKKFCGLALVASMMIACSGGGGGGSDDNNGAPNAPGVFQGYFIDDAVQDLIVEAASGSVQRTDENGVFTFIIGDPLTFKIDDVVIGSVPSGLEVITPGDFGVTSGTQVFRFIQSMDTTPLTPGIDLSGLDLPNTPINFSQQNSFFENDPAVLAALAASVAAGATGVLIDFNTARNNFLAGTNRFIALADFQDLVLYPQSMSGPTEPCLVFFNADLSGQSVCRDDILADPANATEDFSWTVVGGEVVVDPDPDTRVTVTRNGTTGNRIHARVVTECLTCNPNLGPTFETELQTFHGAIDIVAADFDNRSFTLTGPGGTVSASFADDGTAIFDDGVGGVETVEWSVDPVTDVLLLQGTGNPGDSDLSYTRAILIAGDVDDGRYAVLNALVDDTDNSGVADTLEFEANGIFDSVELLDAT